MPGWRKQLLIDREKQNDFPLTKGTAIIGRHGFDLRHEDNIQITAWITIAVQQIRFSRECCPSGRINLPFWTAWER